ncbi:anti-sigma B factor antagonist [Streptacidiphilus sp. MAP12-16]|uniref:STAS domain-containing protein n=1 Tax=Streptacidiphilus sp. MAP12-16 TaxID=3156300 RepID=UPI003512D9E0
MTTLTVTSEAHDSWLLLRVTGEIDLLSGAVIREQVRQVVAAGRRSLVLDLSAVRFCDSSGVGVLIAARRLMRSCSGELRLVLPDVRDRADCAEVHRVFTALGIRRLFDIHPDLASATAEPANVPKARPTRVPPPRLAQSA